MIRGSHVESGEGVELRGHGTRGRHGAVVDIAGAVSVSIAGLDAVTLRLTGNVTGLTLTGWTGGAALADSGLVDTDLHQQVTITVLQDATGGHNFNAAGVAGTWLETPPEFPNYDTAASATSLTFRAWTEDAGATIFLDPVGVGYRLDCTFVDGFEQVLPAINAGSTVAVAHQFQIVTSVELVRKEATGRRVLADWWQQNGDPAAPVNIDFAEAWANGAIAVRVAGKQIEPCVLTPSVTVTPWNEWDTTVLSAANTSNLNLLLEHDGQPGDVQIIPDTGLPAIDVTSGTREAFAYGSAADRQITLRWRRGRSITHFEDATARWSFDLAALPQSLQRLQLTGQNTTSGDVGALPAGLTRYVNWGQNQTSGDIGALPAGLTHFELFGQNTTSGDIGALPAGLTTYINDGQNTTSGDVGALHAGIITYTNWGQNTTSGDIGTLPAGLINYNNQGQNTANYATSYGFGSLDRVFVQIGATGLTSAEVDTILQDIDAAGLNAAAQRSINLTGVNQPRTAASDAAVASLTGRGWNVQTN